MQELNLSPVEIKILLTIIVIILIKLWRKASYFNIEIEQKESLDNLSPKPLQARYGAYIQSQGKYYN